MTSFFLNHARKERESLSVVCHENIFRNSISKHCKPINAYRLGLFTFALISLIKAFAPLQVSD